MSNAETQIYQIVNDINGHLRIVKVLNCPISWIMLCDIDTKTLYIYNLSEIGAVYEAKEFQDQLLYRIERFHFHDGATYYMDSNNLFYEEKG